MALLPDIELLTDNSTQNSEQESLINNIFSKDVLKMLYYHACRVDIADNNEKAELVKDLIGPEFIELGTGTNRIAFLYKPDNERKFRYGAGLVYEIALDRRGFLDSFTEYKRSFEAPEYFVKVYECNMLILVEEYVTLMEKDEFIANELGIKEVLSDLSKAYIFEDIGYNLKNYGNWGYRSNGDIVILDIGYVYSMKGQEEEVMTCPKCKSRIEYNPNYTGFICCNNACRTKFNFLDIRRRMNLSVENFENEMLSDLNHAEMPDFDRLNDDMYSRTGGEL